MIADYPELIAEVTDRTGDASVATRAAMFTGLAESRLNRALALSDMEASATVTTDADGEVALPVDFIRVRLVRKDGYPLSARTLKNIKTSTECGYAITGNTFVSSYANSDHEIDYYQSLPPLATTGTNWLLVKAPELYLYAVIQQVFLAKFDVEKSAASGAFMDGLINELVRFDNLKRHSKTVWPVRGISA